MYVLLIQLSDIHLDLVGNEIVTREELIANVIKDQLLKANRIILIISGDIAEAGRKEQYEIATSFLKRLEIKLRNIKDDIVIDYVITPGNHDCNLETQSSIRDLVIDDIVKHKGLSHCDAKKRGEYLNICLKPQEEYFSWASAIQSIEFPEISGKMLLERSFNLVNAAKLKFYCLNSAWLYQGGGEHGDIIFPLELLPKPESEDNQSTFVFIVVHHPSNWIMKDVSRDFRKSIEAMSNIVMTGHEHESSFREQKYLTGEIVHYIEGGRLQGIPRSSFNTALIDIENRRVDYFSYEWDVDHYLSHEFGWIGVPRNVLLKQDKFIECNSFAQFLSEPGTPLNHLRTDRLTLQDIYVFPDLEEISGKTADNTLINSEHVSEYLLKNKKSIVFSPVFSGKTSLLKSMYHVYKEKKLVPIWLKGASIRSQNPKDFTPIFRESYIEQYGDQYFDEFWQLDPSQRVLLLDDLHETILNKAGILSLFNFIGLNFGNVVIATEDALEISQLTETEGNDFLLECKLLTTNEFGAFLTDKLVEKWLILGQENTIQSPKLDTDIKNITELVTTTLSPNLIPRYPFYILTITQSAEDVPRQIPTPITKDVGSFGYFYGWLITSALYNTPKKIHDVSGKYRYLSEIAYYMFERGTNYIDEDQAANFHKEYLERFALRWINWDYDDLIGDLITARLLKKYNGLIEFQYLYIFYYFVAYAINTRLQQFDHEAQAKQQIRELVQNIDEEKNEFILLFICYLSDNPYVREVILDRAKSMYATNEPTDLVSDLDFINKNTYPVMMSLPQKSPKQARHEVQKKEDMQMREIKRHINDDEKSIEDMDEEIRSVRNALRIMFIMGQMVKNFATVWEGRVKYQLAEESYLLGLRVLKNILAYYAKTYNTFVDEVKKTIKYRQDKRMLALPENRRVFLTDLQLEEAAKIVAFAFTLSVSFNGVNAIAKSVGHEKLYPTHKDILEKFQSLISVRLIDLAIKIDCQYRLPIEDIKSLHKDLSNNAICDLILRRLVFNRMALRETDRTDKQICCKLLDIKENNPRLFIDRRRIDTL